MSAARVERLREVLQREFGALELSVEDDSHRHAGHAGARSGRGHFTVRIVSEKFRGLSPVARHRAVYAALGELMQTDIHALALQARAPGE
jgi:BolA protein